MLGDANPMVVANAVASLCEISTSARQNVLKLDEASGSIASIQVHIIYQYQ